MCCVCAGAGAYAGCAYCCQQGEYCTALNKMVYLEHRYFLPQADPLRSDRTRFPCKQVCLRTTPEKKTQRYIDLANAKLLSVQTAKARVQLTRETGCTGLSSLRKLPYHDRHLNTPVEPMHLVKVIGEHIVKLLSGVEDSFKVRNEEKIRGRFKKSYLIEGDTNKQNLPPAPFCLLKHDIKICNQRALFTTRC